MKLIYLILSCALLVFTNNGYAKKGGNGKPGGGDDPPLNAALLLGSNFKGNHIDIYVADLNGAIERRVRSASKAPIWTADGTQIVWTQRVNDSSEVPARFDIFLANDDGSGEQLVVAGTDEMRPYTGGTQNLSTSHSFCGTPTNVLYFLGSMTQRDSGWEEIFAVDLDAPQGSLMQLTTSDESVRHTTVEVSPDGKFIATWSYPSPDVAWRFGTLEIRDACNPDDVLYSWTAEDLGQVPGFVYPHVISWSSTNILAIWGHEHPGGDDFDDIWLVDLNVDLLINAEVPDVFKLIGDGGVFGQGFNNRSPTWSPDGKMLAFGQSGTGKTNDTIYVMDVDSASTNFGVVTAVSNRAGRLGELDWRRTWTANP